jgi:AraC-like DNA-binding protein
MTSPPSCLRAVKFSTDLVPERRRYEVWRACLNGLYESSAGAPEDFRFESSTWHFEEFVMSEATGSARAQARTARAIRADQMDHYHVVCRREGVSHIDADGRRVVLEPGQVAIFDLARPVSFQSQPGRSIVLEVPREALDDVLPRPADLHGVVARGAPALVLGGHLRSLAQYAPELERQDAVSFARPTVQMIAAAFAAGADPQAAGAGGSATLLRQACRFIEMHLAEPALSAQAVCAAFKLSRATLYRLFTPLGGVSAFIKERRLLRVHDQLSAGDARSIAQVAEAHGFVDVSHFGKAFRERFGYSPGEARQRAVAAPAPVVEAPDGRNVALYRDWLRALCA